jgi:hypothetical protein
MKKKRTFRKLTPTQKKEVWKPTEENAGAGWEAKGTTTGRWVDGENYITNPPRRFIPNRERDSEPFLTEIFKKSK